MPRTGHFILHSNVLPKVTAGRYELCSEHIDLPFEVEPETTHVTVAAPRYTMPTEQILSSFPPANAEGAFGDRLPQIVLKRRTLPWERNPQGGPLPSAQRPWLALVVVAEGEAELSTATPVRDCVTPGVTLPDPDDRDTEQGLYLAVTETVVKKVFPCREDLPLLVHVREVNVNDTELANGDDDGWLSVVLGNRLPVFDSANGKPVRYMACLVNLEGQLEALPPPTPPVEVFDFALAQDWSVLATVNANALPDQRVIGGVALGDAVLPRVLGQPRAAGGAVAASAPLQIAADARIGGALDGAASMQQAPVSVQWKSATEQVSAAALDPDAKRLVRDTMARGFRYPIELYAVEKVLRFPVLAHWSFTTRGDASFEKLMQELDVGLLGALPEPAPGAIAVDAIPEVVQTGHIGLDHRTRRGDPVRAWYRGPCVPFPTPRDSQGGDAPLPLAHSADQLRRIIPDGREDLGLAAAFEIGRLLALSQLSVVSALLRFRSEQFGAGRVGELLSQLVAFDLPALAGERVDLGRFVALRMLEEMAHDSDRMIGPRRPVADPGRPLPVSGDLDELIATGLGLDLRTLRKQAETVGVLAALEGTGVPLALKAGQTPDEKLVVPALRTALQDELQGTLEVAVPTRVRPVRGQRRGRARAAAAPAPDALDSLIAQATDEDSEETS